MTSAVLWFISTTDISLLHDAGYLQSNGLPASLPLYVHIRVAIPAAYILIFISTFDHRTASNHRHVLRNTYTNVFIGYRLERKSTRLNARYLPGFVSDSAIWIR